MSSILTIHQQETKDFIHEWEKEIKFQKEDMKMVNVHYRKVFIVPYYQANAYQNNKVSFHTSKNNILQKSKKQAMLVKM